MKIQIKSEGNRTYQISWAHEEYEPENAPIAKQQYVSKLLKNTWISKTKRMKTICVIDAGGEAYVAEVKCYFKDRYNRLVGNKEAFRKAVNLITNKTIRKELWQAFLELSPKYTNKA